MALTKTRKIGKLINANRKFLAFDSDQINSTYSKGKLPTPGSVLVVSTAEDLPVSSTSGNKAIVTSTNTLYLYSNGWYKIAIINNFNPQWITQPSGSYNLAVNGTATSITVLASDSDDVPITYIATPDSDFLTFATVTHDSDKDNTWIIQPIDSENGAAVGGTGNVTFKASDGVNLVQAVSSFNLSFSSIDSLSFLANADAMSRKSTSPIEARLYATGYANGTTFPYTITGVNSSDISTPLSGNMTYNSSAGYAPLTITSLYDTTISQGTDTGTISVGGLTDTFTVVPLKIPKSIYIVKRDAYFNNTDQSFGTEGFIMYDLDSYYTTVQNMFNAGGTAGDSSWSGYRQWRSCKIYCIKSGVPTHVTTFSWTGQSNQMTAGYFTSGSIQGIRSYDASGNYTCSRTFTTSGISGNYFGELAAVEFFSDANASVKINTVLADGYAF